MMTSITSFRLQVSVVQRSEGGNALRRAAYQSASVLADDRSGERFDYTGKRAEVLVSRILAPAGAPDWVYDRAQLWQRAECAEKRRDAQVGRCFDYSIPRGIPADLRQAFAEHLFAPFLGEGMVIDYSLHNELASDGKEQPHVSGLATMRRLDANGAYGFSERKASEWNGLFADFRKKAGLKNLPHAHHAKAFRAEFAARANEFCAAHGLGLTVTLASNEDLGLSPPQPILTKRQMRQLQRIGADIRAVEREICAPEVDSNRAIRQQVAALPPARTWRDFVADARSQALSHRASAAAIQVPKRGNAPPPRDAAQVIAVRREAEARRVALVRHNAAKLSELRAQPLGVRSWLFSPVRTWRRLQMRLENEMYSQQALNAAEMRQQTLEHYLDSDQGGEWARRVAGVERNAWLDANAPADRAERQKDQHDQQANKLLRLAALVEATAGALAHSRAEDGVSERAVQHLESLAQMRPDAFPDNVQRDLWAFAKLNEHEQLQQAPRDAGAITSPTFATAARLP